MEVIEYPDQWADLLQRPVFDQKKLDVNVSNIIQQVKLNGDKALLELTQKFDKISIDNIEVSTKEIKEAENLVSKDLREAIDIAIKNISKFHESQKEEAKKIETSKGVFCWRKSVAIEKVGLYIPGGLAPLFSTVLMLGIPANIAGCKEVILCTPPDKNGKINPAILYAASKVGVTKIFKTGGAQAIAAMAFGTETIPAVYKIFGPGNQYVTAAKQLVNKEGIAIDMPAGPSEVLVIADETCNPEFVAADLLSQAEHGPDSQVILLSNNKKVVDEILIQVKLQLEKLPRREITAIALSKSKAIVLKNLNEAMDFSNQYAPEHLILAVKEYAVLSDKVINAGSVFLGNYSSESFGDYASGTNHTLPTNGFAKAYSGVSLDSFVKKITFQEVTKIGLKELGGTVEAMAAAEGLDAHKNAVTVRLKTRN